MSGTRYYCVVTAVSAIGQSVASTVVSATPLQTGYDLAGSDGGVFVFPVGQASGFFGSLPGLGVKVNNIVGIVPTNNFTGYNLVGSDGGVFVFPVGQSSGFFGSLPGLGVSVNNIVGIVPTNNDQGYDLVGNDGGVFVFPVGQSAGFYGSLPSMNVHVSNIVGIVATPGGGGYFLVGKDGGVFAFGNAPFFGSLPGHRGLGQQHRGDRLDPRRPGLLRSRGQRRGLRVRGRQVLRLTARASGSAFPTS